MSSYKALRVNETEKTYSLAIESMERTALQEGEVRVQVQYSSLNYKDALSAAGNKGVTRNFPHTPGIDAAGIVIESADSQFAVNDQVIVTSYNLGMSHPGGFAEEIQVPGTWVVPMPQGFTSRGAMEHGTAGFTAALSVHRMIKNGEQTPEMGPIVVTGALGGVGSVACQILNKLGFEVIAASSKGASEEQLKQIGATSQLTLEESSDQSGRPMLRTNWAGAIDVVGGNTLTTMLKGCQPMGNVTTCGNIGSGDLDMTVFPFILRGVSLIGIDSQNCPMPLRTKLWNLLANEWKIEMNEALITETNLEELPQHISNMHAKKGRGRVIVKL